MTRQQPITTSGDDRVVPFRPRKVSPAALVAVSSAIPAGSVTLATKASATKLPATPLLVAQRDDSRQASKMPSRTLSRRSRTARPSLAAEGEEVDYQRRVMTSLAALVFTLLLTGVGVWLATTIADMRRVQDCVLVGRHDCPRPPLPNVLPVRLMDHT
jgi:hypothetical protein